MQWSNGTSYTQTITIESDDEILLEYLVFQYQSRISSSAICLATWVPLGLNKGVAWLMKEILNRIGSASLRNENMAGFNHVALDS